MRFTKSNSGPLGLLPLLFVLFLFASRAMAASATTTDATSSTTATATDDDSSTSTTAATTTTASTSDDDSSTTNTASSTDATTTTDSDSSTASTTDTASSTDTDSTSSSTSATSSTSTAYPTATVPPTANAPYMKSSNMPEGTVFIAVGAILGFMAVSVLAWRGLVAWSLHRSVNRAAMHQSMGDVKAMFKPPPAPFYTYSDRDSNSSLPKVTKSSKAHRKSRPASQNPATTAQNLFFSPTAGSGLQTGGNRGSTYLPSGYYAAGNSAPAGGNSQQYLGTGGDISMSNLHPQTYSRGSSPADSPEFVGQRRGHQTNASASTLNLNQPRAPSAYLEDLFDEHGTGHGSGRPF